MSDYSYQSDGVLAERQFSTSSEIQKYSKLFPGVDISSILSGGKEVVRDQYDVKKESVSYDDRSSQASKKPGDDELYKSIHNFASEFVFYYERMKHQKERLDRLEEENNGLKRKVDEVSSQNRIFQNEKEVFERKLSQSEKTKVDLVNTLNKQQQLFNLKDKDFQLIKRKYDRLLLENQTNLLRSQEKKVELPRPYPQESSVDWKKKYFELEESRGKVLKEKAKLEAQMKMEQSSLTKQLQEDNEQLRNKYEEVKNFKSRQDTHLQNMEVWKMEQKKKMEELEKQRDEMKEKLKKVNISSSSNFQRQQIKIEKLQDELEQTRGEYHGALQKVNQKVSDQVFENIKKENDDLKKMVMRLKITNDRMRSDSPERPEIKEKEDNTEEEEEKKKKDEIIQKLEQEQLESKSLFDRLQNDFSVKKREYDDLRAIFEKTNREKEKQGKVIRSLKLKLKDTSKKKFFTDEKNKKLIKLVNDQKLKISQLLTRQEKPRNESLSAPSNPAVSREHRQQQTGPPMGIALPGLSQGLPVYPQQQQQLRHQASTENMNGNKGRSNNENTGISKHAIENIEKENESLKRVCEKRQIEVEKLVRDVAKMKELHRRNMESFQKQSTEQFTKISGENKLVKDRLKQFQGRFAQLQKQRDRNKEISEKYSKLYKSVHKKFNVLRKQHLQLKLSHQEIEKQDEMIRECYSVVMLSEKKLKRKLKHLKKDIRVYGSRYQKQTKRIKEENQKLEEECKRCKRIILKLRNEKVVGVDQQKLILQHPTLVKDVELIRTRDLLDRSRKDVNHMKLQVQTLKESNRKASDEYLRKNENLEENLRRLKVAYIDITKKKNAIFKTLTEENKDLKEDMKKQIHKKVLLLKKSLSKEKAQWLKSEEKRLQLRSKKEVEKIEQTLKKNSELELDKMVRIEKLEEMIRGMGEENERIKEKYKLLKMLTDSDISANGNSNHELIKNMMSLEKNNNSGGDGGQQLENSVVDVALDEESFNEEEEEEEEEMDEEEGIDDIDDDDEDEEEEEEGGGVRRYNNQQKRRVLDIRDVMDDDEEEEEEEEGEGEEGVDRNRHVDDEGDEELYESMDKEREFEKYKNEMLKLNQRIRNEMDSLKM